MWFNTKPYFGGFICISLRKTLRSTSSSSTSVGETPLTRPTYKQSHIWRTLSLSFLRELKTLLHESKTLCLGSVSSIRRCCPISSDGDSLFARSPPDSKSLSVEVFPLEFLLKMRRSASKKTGQSNSTASVNSSAADLFRSGISQFSIFLFLIFQKKLITKAFLRNHHVCYLMDSYVIIEISYCQKLILSAVVFVLWIVSWWLWTIHWSIIILDAQYVRISIYWNAR